MSSSLCASTIYILGRFDCPRVTHCKLLVSELENKIKTHQKIKFILCFETQFNAYRDSLLKTNKELLQYSQSPIIYLESDSDNSKTIVGSLEEFQNYSIENYCFHDTHSTEEYISETKNNLKTFLSTNGNTYVYLDFNFEGSTANERVVFELFNNICPRTAQNFFQTCVGFTNNQGKEISYKGTIINRVSENSFVQGGWIKVSGSCNSFESKEFDDENYNVQHDTPGILGMVKKGWRNHTSNCQFYVTLCPLKSFDKKWVAFGRVIKGYEVIQKIGEIETDLQRPTNRIEIRGCGEFTIE